MIRPALVTPNKIQCASFSTPRKHRKSKDMGTAKTIHLSMVSKNPLSMGQRKKRCSGVVTKRRHWSNRRKPRNTFMTISEGILFFCVCATNNNIQYFLKNLKKNVITFKKNLTGAGRRNIFSNFFFCIHRKGGYAFTNDPRESF